MESAIAWYGHGLAMKWQASRGRVMHILLQYPDTRTRGWNLFLLTLQRIAVVLLYCLSWHYILNCNIDNMNNEIDYFIFILSMFCYTYGTEWSTKPKVLGTLLTCILQFYFIILIVGVLQYSIIYLYYLPLYVIKVVYLLYTLIILYK